MQARNCSTTKTHQVSGAQRGGRQRPATGTIRTRGQAGTKGTTWQRRHDLGGRAVACQGLGYRQAMDARTYWGVTTHVKQVAAQQRPPSHIQKPPQQRPPSHIQNLPQLSGRSPASPPTFPEAPRPGLLRHCCDNAVPLNLPTPEQPTSTSHGTPTFSSLSAAHALELRRRPSPLTGEALPCHHHTSHTRARNRRALPLASQQPPTPAQPLGSIIIIIII